MLKKLFVITILLEILLISNSNVKAYANNDLEISNKYFSFTMPVETKGTYNVEKEGSGIFVIEKISQNAGMGGFAFGLKLYKSPGEYAGIDGNTKLGELTDKNGAVYDMVLVRPTDVQLGDGEEIQKNFNRLYEFGNNVEIKGVNGCKYIKEKGMKGEELYEKVLNKYKIALTKKWDSYKEFEKEDLNPIFYDLTQSKYKIGYTYYDINSDGIDELIIGKIGRGKSKGMIYDIYTMVDRIPKRVKFIDNKAQIFVCNDVFLCCNCSSTKHTGTITIYGLNNNSIKLYIHDEFSYDKKKRKYNNEIRYYNYNRFDFVPLLKQ